MEKIKCRVCGSLEDPARWVNKDRLVKKQLCFECDFWDEIIPEYNKGNHFVTEKNECYCIGNENSSDHFRGFDGAKVTITFNDGKVVNSTNLWYRGIVPKQFQDTLKPNAKLEWK